jgi:predicted small secreted protein
MNLETRQVLLAATATVVTLCGAVLSGGCNTLEGVGQDVENLGDEIGDEAREQRRRNNAND